MKGSDGRSIDWAHLRGVDGEATGAAGSLRDLLKGDAKARANALRALQEELVPEGNWCAAGAAATPLLVEMAVTGKHPAQPQALILLADLLVGNHTT